MSKNHTQGNENLMADDFIKMYTSGNTEENIHQEIKIENNNK